MSIFPSSAAKGVRGTVMASHAVLRFNAAGRLVAANGRFLTMAGAGLADVRGMSQADLAWPTASNDGVWSDVLAGRTRPGTVFYRLANGTDLRLEGTYAPRRSIFGGVKDVVFVGTRATEAFQSLLHDAETLAAIDSSHVVLELDGQGRVLRANACFLLATGLREAEIVGAHYSTALATPPDDAEERAFWSDLRRGQRCRRQIGFRTEAGGGVWLDGAYDPVKSRDGSIDRIVMTATDASAAMAQHIRTTGIAEAVDRSQAVIEFEPDGTIIYANENFLKVMGYSLSDLRGQHHSMFVPKALRESTDYESFWERIRSGEVQAAEFQRQARDGTTVWIQAMYSPVRDPDGSVVRVIKVATDITETKLRSMRDRAQVVAIDRSQAVIEFETSGNVRWANANFLDLMGYSLEEIAGTHHRRFVPREEAGLDAYEAFWDRLRSGEYVSDVFKRIAASGREVWIQATYSPILDSDGTVTGITKIATDVTEARETMAIVSGKVGALENSQAVIEFDLDGKIVKANDQFLRTMGYSAEEVLGRPHSMFLPGDDAVSSAYREFWADLRGGGFRTGQFRRRAKDGRDVWIEGTYAGIRTPDGSTIRIFKFARDITEDVAQRERVQLLSLVTDETDNSVIISDAQGRIEFANRGFERMTGYELADVRGRKPGDFLQGPETCPKARARISEALKQGRALNEDILNYSRSGTPYWISLAINPIRNHDGVVERFVSIQSNIDATKQSAIEFSRRMDAISSTCALAEWSADGTFAACNEYLQTACADAPERMALSSLLDPGDRACLSLGETVLRQIEWPRPGRPPLVLSAVFNSVPDQSGKVAKLLMFGIDATARDQVFEGAIGLVRNYSDRIGAIVADLEQISSETRNLSLNATVEATRSGESGKGFSVVAGEVRALADKSNEAVGDIRRLLDSNIADLSALEGRLSQINAGKQACDETEEERAWKLQEKAVEQDATTFAPDLRTG